MCVHFDIVYVPANTDVSIHPGARSMHTERVGAVQLENGQWVFVTSIVRPMDDGTRRQITKLRTTPLLDREGNPLKRVGNGMFAFGKVPNLTPVTEHTSECCST
jgi:hypothetical protein